MRALLAVLLAFGPADPAVPIDASCMDASADTIAIGRETPRGWVIETSTADGPWLRVIGPLKREYRDDICPQLSAAADGTAVVAGSANFGDPLQYVAVRWPGGAFGAPTALRSQDPLSVLAEPGGKVEVDYRDKGDRKRLQLRVDGPPVTTAVPAESTPSADAPLTIARDQTGRALRVQLTADGLRAQVGDEPSTIVAPVYETYGEVGALAEDGSAVVVYQDQERGLYAVDRGPNGVWSQPHALPRGGNDALLGFGIDEPYIKADVGIAPGGRIVVAWPLANRGPNVAVAGQAGGPWGAATVLSPPSRMPGYPRVIGDRVLWLEPNHVHGPGPLRGARVGVPAPVDTTKPKYTLRVPRVIKATRKRQVTVSITVRCDEACDVLLDSGDSSEGYIAQALAAGERRTLRLRDPSVYTSGTYRFRYAFVVSDRAGNAHRRTLRIRVRVP